MGSKNYYKGKRKLTRHWNIEMSTLPSETFSFIFISLFTLQHVVATRLKRRNYRITVVFK